MRLTPAGIERRVRAICLEFPEVIEKSTHGAPGFFVRKQFAMLWPSGHHDHEFAHLWCAAEPGAQEALTATSERYFRPPYVGGAGWVGIELPRIGDEELAAHIHQAWKMIGQKKPAARPRAGAKKAERARAK